ncbi:MAG: tRNA threonylcarbamoyladenosine dehydratase [Betaproteobacteria bacterium]|nr:tRNA threonylcarbamoyladenosine dehydratase [Betaproteobacteria bacterium]
MPDYFPIPPDVDPKRRFGGLERLYGEGTVTRLAAARVAVVGIGGVGCWVAEALARSGIGMLKLIDPDNLVESNINRQIHAFDSTLGQAKVTAMAARVGSIHPQCRVEVVEDFLTPENAATLLCNIDLVVDAIDHVRAKAAIAVHCCQTRLPLLMAGGAGGKTDPRQIRVEDLALTTQDPLLSKVRARLRREYGFTHEPGKKFGIETVTSNEPLRQPTTCSARPQGLSCAGYGSSMAMTAGIAMFIAARVLERLLRPTAGVSAPPAKRPGNM